MMREATSKKIHNLGLGFLGVFLSFSPYCGLCGGVWITPENPKHAEREA